MKKFRKTGELTTTGSGIKPACSNADVKKKGNGQPKRKIETRFVCCAEEDHKQPVYSVAFYDGPVELEEDILGGGGVEGEGGGDRQGGRHSAGRGGPTIFAVAGGPRVSVYRLLPSKEGGLELAQAYLDGNREETFYCCAWTRIPPGHGGLDEEEEEDGEGEIEGRRPLGGRRRRKRPAAGGGGARPPAAARPLLACGGLTGLVKVVDAASGRLWRALVGHGNAVNDARWHPVDPALLLTASKDETLRLWHAPAGQCVAVFSGERGHRDEVLSCDFHPLGHALASAGMDNSVKVWNLGKEGLRHAVAGAYAGANPSASRAFPTVRQQFPDFSTALVHANYVDCVRWLGNLLLSKSCLADKSPHNKIVLWKPDPARGSSAVIVLREFLFPDGNLWYVRFGLDADLRRMAVGNNRGQLFVWNLDGSKQPAAKAAHPKCQATIRHAAFSPDGKTLISVTDDSTVWRWNIL